MIFKNCSFLKLAVVAFKTFAVISIILSLFSCISLLVVHGAPQAQRWMGVVTLVAGVSYSFTLLVIGEVINLLLRINERIR